MKADDLFDTQLLAKGINKIRAHYLKYGYYDAQVHFVAKAIPLTDAVEVSFDVREGHRGYIKKIAFRGHGRGRANSVFAVSIIQALPADLERNH